MKKTCGKNDCNRIAQHKHGGSVFCDKHYKFHNIICDCKQNRKYIPGYEELENLLNQLIDMKCPICRKQMIWNKSWGDNKNIISFYQNNDKILLICKGCNLKRATHSLKDKCFDIPKNFNYCCLCKNILNKNQFPKYKKITYCYKCNALKNMRSHALQDNKYIPTLKELNELIPYDMMCPTCHKFMVWHKQLGKYNDVISLQHNLDGKIMLICMACNNGHGHSTMGDKYFNISLIHKYCPYCKKILSKFLFYKNKSQKDKLDCYCKKCSKQYKKRKKINHE